jgi:ABC-type uncharacterized transport system permease subunit
MAPLSPLQIWRDAVISVLAPVHPRPVVALLHLLGLAVQTVAHTVAVDTERMTEIGAKMMAVEIIAVMMTTGAVMIVAVIAGMIAVTDAEMMVVATAGQMDAVQTASLLHMLTLSAKFVRNMAILQVLVGGAILMTRRTEMMVTKEQILRHMVSTQTGTLIQVPLIILLVN